MGETTSNPCAPTSRCTARSAFPSTWSTPTRSRALWPGIHLDDFAAFAYEPLGGHGDAYMTGMPYGARARALGVRIRQSTNVFA
ncbi:hypothetical protein GS436_12095 [Rhodococcus hoagii]|nr:hypothetical protein [Prescottella equi]